MKKSRDFFSYIINNYKQHIVLSMLFLMCILLYSANSNIIDEADTANLDTREYYGTCDLDFKEANKLTINGKTLAISKDIELENLKSLALNILKEKLGYDYDEDIELTISNVDAQSEENLVYFSDEQSLATEIADRVYAGIDEFKVPAYLLKIGDDFVVALETEDDLKEALDYAKSKYLDVDSDTADIALIKDEKNPLIISPVLKLNKQVDKKNLRTSANSDEDNEKDDKIQEETIVDASFANEVIAVQSYVDKSEIKVVEEAKELITKENEKEKKYVVEPGDYPEIIAGKNDMPTKKLYDLNPGLESRDTAIQIGEELTVMVPEPELSVAITERLIYDEPVDCETTYKPNPDKYVGHEIVEYEGKPGVNRITAEVKKLNDTEINRKIVEEKLVKEPEDKIILRGSKPLPSRGATGVFISPLESYIVTSPYGYRWGRLHKGIDLSSSYGSNVMASDGGVVTFAGWRGSYGNTVVIDHGDGCSTLYAHNSELLVSAGQYVSQYESIAKLGSSGNSTGPHVHFEVRFDGVSVNPTSYVNF